MDETAKEKLRTWANAPERTPELKHLLAKANEIIANLQRARQVTPGQLRAQILPAHLIR